jgi:hypothetical protein
MYLLQNGPKAAKRLLYTKFSSPTRKKNKYNHLTKVVPLAQEGVFWLRIKFIIRVEILGVF